MNRGTIFLLGGINDVWVVGRSWRRWLAEVLPHRIELIRWQQGPWAILTFADLWRTAHHRQVAAELATRIRQAQAAFPGEPVHILAHSAGSAIAAYTLEKLKPSESITSAVFVGSGLSPHFDLSSALAGTRAGILSVESIFDLFFLGIGTSLLGSADRRWGPAAGMVGFQQTTDERLIPLRWRPRYLLQGWLGGHISVASPWFVRRTLASWIRQSEGSGGGTSGSGLRAKIHSSIG